MEKNGKFIEPDHLDEYEFDYIYITSEKYFHEIRETLTEKFGKRDRKIRLYAKEKCSEISVTVRYGINGLSINYRKFRR